MKQPEKEIENNILEWLAWNNIFSFKVKSQGTWDEAKKTFRRPSKYYKRGTADILGIYKTYPLACEVKSEKGRLSIHQKAFLEEWRKNGGIAIVARSVDDVEEALKEFDQAKVERVG